MDITQDQVIAILQNALEQFREEIHGDVTAARILILLATYKNPGLPQGEVERHVPDLSQASISRNILDLSNFTTRREPGPDLITQRVDPMYRKRNLLYPTAKGQEFVNRVATTAIAQLKKTANH